MADLSRVREPLEIAAASPDPKVRQMAIRRKELEVDIQRLDNFFSLYAGEEPANGNGEPVAAAPAAKPGRKPRSARPDKDVPKQSVKRGKHGAFLENIKEALLKYGPLDKESLFARYKEFAPEDTTRTVESMRVSLVRYPSDITRVSKSDKRYWVVGEPLAQTFEEAA